VVFEGLGAVQELGQTNMLDYDAVCSIATRMGYSEAALWVAEHHPGAGEKHRSHHRKQKYRLTAHPDITPLSWRGERRKEASRPNSYYSVTMAGIRGDGYRPGGLFL
jgi:hypothetical protein